MTGQRRKRRVVTVGLVVVTCASMWLVWGTSANAAMLLLEWAPPRSDLGATPPRAPDLIAPMKIGPVEGLTTGWHGAPAKTAIPLGTLLQLRQHAPLGATVTWTGAVEVMRDESGSTAECPLEAIGEQIVRVTLEQPGRQRFDQSIHLDVVDISADEVRVGPIHVAVEALNLDENSTNEETMRFFFGQASIAALRELGENRYRTSINKPLLLKVEVQPPAFAPLIEWRIDEEPRILGASVEQGINEIGNHTVTAGPPARSNVVHVETYSVTITSHRSNYDFVPEGEPVLFEAVTDPPGYEDEITWLSSTKYGTAAPVLGEGATFTVQFDDTWGSEDGFQWLGVKADNGTFGQDQKFLILLCCTGGECCEDSCETCAEKEDTEWCRYKIEPGDYEETADCSWDTNVQYVFCVECPTGNPGECPLNQPMQIGNDACKFRAGRRTNTNDCFSCDSRNQWTR